MYMDAYKKRQIMYAGLNLWKKFFFLGGSSVLIKSKGIIPKPQIFFYYIQQKCLDVQSIEGDRRIER